MRRYLLLLLVMGGVSLSVMAQDDMYFTPSKQKKQVSEVTPVKGLDMGADEYNRRMRSSYQKIGTDSLGNDIIEFQAGDGVYPDADTLYASSKYDKSYDDEDDFYYSRRMGLYDGFYGWYDPFFFPYHAWNSWYYPWGYYYGWYDPWYWGWYDPWFYTSGYGYPYYWGYPYYGGYISGRGSYHHGNVVAHRGSNGVGSRGRGYSTATYGTFGGSAVRNSSTGSRGSYANRSSSRSTGTFGGSRSNSSSSTWTPSRSPSSSSGSYSGSGSYGGSGSFGGGGSRSGGGFSGGGHSSGGGGGSRSGGFGGRR